MGFVIHELSKKQTSHEIMEVLHSVPPGLPAIYSRMLLRTEASRQSIISEILRWVTMAVRPLTVHELTGAIAIPSIAPLSSDRTIRDHITMCGPILRIRLENHPEDSAVDEVHLVHQSARDYLLRKERDEDLILEGFRIEEEEAHSKLTRVCLDCIEKSDLRYEPLDINDASVLEKSPLLNYASLHWAEHARKSSAYADKELSLSRPFFQKKSCVRKNWFESYQKAEPPWPLYNVPLLHTACYFGIDSLARKLLAQNARRFTFQKLVDKRDDRGRTPLLLAARRGLKATVRLLLDYDPDVNIKDKESGFTALILSALGGHCEIVQLLLEKGADINLEAENGPTPLIAAVSLGLEAVVRLLLKHGADVNMKVGKPGKRALAYAISTQNETIVQLLVNNNADVNAELLPGGFTALNLAILTRQKAIVRLLLEHGADVNANDNRNLFWAAQEGDEATLQLLLEHGVDVNAKDGISGNTMLIYAARQGREAIMRLLMNNNADINAKNVDGQTALTVATGEGYEAAVRLLLEYGANVHASDLALATHEAIVRLLNSHGAS